MLVGIGYKSGTAVLIALTLWNVGPSKSVIMLNTGEKAMLIVEYDKSASTFKFYVN